MEEQANVVRQAVARPPAEGDSSNFSQGDFSQEQKTARMGKNEAWRGNRSGQVDSHLIRTGICPIKQE